LLLGITRGGPETDGALSRVLFICEQLGISGHLLEFVQEGEKGATHVWAEVLANSEKWLLGIARAIITNPELMCIHKPLMAQNDVTSKKVMHVLKKFVEEKGFGLDMDTRHLRRPRTCILTAAKAQSAKAADKVFKVSHAGGVELIDKAEIDSNLG